jgi:hypothetical protein
MVRVGVFTAVEMSINLKDISHDFWFLILLFAERPTVNIDDVELVCTKLLKI